MTENVGWVEQRLLLHDNAPVYWLLSVALAALLLVVSLFTPLPELVSQVVLGISFIWLWAGASVGWLPRP